MSAKLPEGAGKRHAIALRTTREMKERIEASAAQSGRSIAQEIEARVQYSFDMDRYAEAEQSDPIAQKLDRETKAMMSCIEAAVGAAMLYSGSHWREDIYTRACVSAAMSFAMGAFFGRHKLDISEGSIDSARLDQANNYGRLLGRMISAAEQDPATRAWIAEMADLSRRQDEDAGASKEDVDMRRSAALKLLTGEDA